MARPDVGDLTLWPETFHIAGTPGQQPIVAQAEPGSPSEHALIPLGGLAASRAPPLTPSRT